MILYLTELREWEGVSLFFFRYMKSTYLLLLSHAPQVMYRLDPADPSRPNAVAQWLVENFKYNSQVKRLYLLCWARFILICLSALPGCVVFARNRPWLPCLSIPLSLLFNMTPLVSCKKRVNTQPWNMHAKSNCVPWLFCAYVKLFTFSSKIVVGWCSHQLIIIVEIMVLKMSWPDKIINWLLVA